MKAQAAALAGAIVLLAASSDAFAPPAAVREQVAQLALVSRFTDLPAAVRAGDFAVDGVSAAGWRMAEPGGAFNATDTPIGDAPMRRLFFAGCDATLCLIHYERGGIAHFYVILALSKRPSGWHAVWNAVGKAPLKDLAALRALVERPSSGSGWNNQWVKGDF